MRFIKNISLCLFILGVTSVGYYSIENAFTQQDELTSGDLAPDIYISKAASSSINALMNQGDAITQHITIENLYQSDKAGFFMQQHAQTLMPQPLLTSDFKVSVTGNIVRTRVSQRFSNISEKIANGIYVFPLPQDAAVDAMQMRIGQRVIEGKIMQKDIAERTFVKAKKKGQSASLVKQLRPNIFINKIANIEANTDIVVQIEYQQVLKPSADGYELRIPTAVNPRYTSSKDALFEQSKTTPNTSPLQAEMNVTVDINTGVELVDFESLHHDIFVSHKAKTAYTVSLENQKALADDFVLSWRLQTQQTPQVLHVKQNLDGFQYGLIQVIAPSSQSFHTPRNVTFILDTSGSMAGPAIKQAKSALKSGIAALTERDTFNIIEFNSRAQNLWTAPQPASAAHKDEAYAFIEYLNASGGTEMTSALELSFALSKFSNKNSERLDQMLFITDGSVSNEAELLQLIAQQIDDKRLFTIGIGSAPNTYFMKEAAMAGKGTFTLIGDIRQVNDKMQALLSKISQPSLSSVSLLVNGTDSAASANTFEIYPKKIRDVYAGETIRLIYRAAGPFTTENELGITGIWHNKLSNHSTKTDVATSNKSNIPAIWQTKLPAPNTQANAGLSQQWAYEKIRQLSRTLHTSALSGEDLLDLQTYTKAEITDTALQHHLVSQYTSLIAVDEQVNHSSTTANPSQAKPSAKQITWTAAQLSLPQTGGASQFKVIVGLSLLLAASLLLFVRMTNVSR